MMDKNQLKDLIDILTTDIDKEESGVRYIAFTAEKGMSMHKTLGGAIMAVAESCNCWIYKEYDINKRDLIWRYTIDKG